jgi:hypothetical protein
MATPSSDTLATIRELFDAGHHAGVIAVCSAQLDLHSSDVALLLQRARAWIALRRIDQAQVDLREVLRLDVRCVMAYRMLAPLLRRTHRLATARYALRRVVYLCPDDDEAREWLAEVEAEIAVEAMREQMANEKTAVMARESRSGSDAVPEFVSETGSSQSYRADDAEVHPPHGEEPAVSWQRREPSHRGERNAADRSGPRRMPRAQTAPMRLPANRRATTQSTLRRSPTAPIMQAPSTAPLRRAATAPMAREGASVAVHPPPIPPSAPPLPHGVRAGSSRAATTPALGRATSTLRTERVDPGNDRPPVDPVHLRNSWSPPGS